MSHYNVVPECYADTLLVKMLGFEKPNHQHGIGKVTKVLNEKLSKIKAVGIIDNDKKKPKDLAVFQVLEEKQRIQKLKKADGQHTILTICPAFETWIFENAKAVQVDPAKFGFQNQKYFQNQCKNPNAESNQQLKQFLNTLIQKQAPGLVQLEKWISEAIEK